MSFGRAVACAMAGRGVSVCWQKGAEKAPCLLRERAFSARDVVPRGAKPGVLPIDIRVRVACETSLFRSVSEGVIGILCDNLRVGGLEVRDQRGHVRASASSCHGLVDIVR